MSDASVYNIVSAFSGDTRPFSDQYLHSLPPPHPQAHRESGHFASGVQTDSSNQFSSSSNMVKETRLAHDERERNYDKREKKEKETEKRGKIVTSTSFIISSHFFFFYFFQITSRL